MAGGYVEVFEFGGVVIQVQRRRREPDERPDGHTDADGHFVVLPLLGQRMSHDPVPLHAEAGDEEDRAVHVPVEEAHEDFAQRLPVGPVVAVEMVGDFKGRPDDKKQVGQSQVSHVDGGRVLLLGPEEEHPDGHAVGRKSHRKHDDVHDWYEDGGQRALQGVRCRLVHNNLPRVFRVHIPAKSPSFS